MALAKHNFYDGQVLTAAHLNSIEDNVSDELISKQPTLVSGVNIKTINGTSILGSGDITIDIPEVTVDTALSNTSENPVQNKIVKAELDKKQATLVSGTNIKTVNGQSLLGSGNVAIQSGDVIIEGKVYK